MLKQLDIASAHREQLQRHYTIASLVQALWSWQRGLNPDIHFLPNSHSGDAPELQPASRTLKMLLGEWVELVAGTVDHHPPSIFLELADIIGFSFHYPAIVARTLLDDVNRGTLNMAEMQRAQEILATAYLAADPVEFVCRPSAKNSNRERSAVQHWLHEVGKAILVMHAEMLGCHPNGSRQAEVKMSDIDWHVGQAIQKILLQVQSVGEVSKEFENQIIDSFLNINNRIYAREVARKDLEPVYLLASLVEQIGIDWFGIQHSVLAAGALYLDADNVDGTEVRGKNARNYPRKLPPGMTMTDVKKIRRNFADSMLPPDFDLRNETLEEYFARIGLRYPNELNLAAQETRQILRLPDTLMTR